MYTVNAEHSLALQEEARLDVESGLLGGIGRTIMSYPAVFAGSAAQGLTYAGNILERALGISGSDRPIDVNNQASTAMNVTQAGRQAVSDELDAWSGTINLPLIGEVGIGKLYQAINGSIDNMIIRGMTGAGLGISGRTLANGALSGLTGGRVNIGNGDGNAISSAYYLLSGFGSGTDEALQRGASDSQALAYGLMTGSNELIFETISLDRLLSMDDAATIGGAVLNVLKQAFVEGSEELATSLANTFADEFIMGDKSQLETRRAELMDEGYTADEAGRMALEEWGQSIAWDFIMGAAEGGFSAAGHQMGNVADLAGANRQSRRENRETGRKIFGNNSTQAMTDMARAMTADERVQEALRAFEKRGTDKNAGVLYRAISEGLGEYNSQALREAVQADVRAAMESGLGEGLTLSEDVMEALTKAENELKFAMGM